MAGLHAFADRPRAIEEMRRVVHEQGTFLACSYVKGVRRVTDWIVKHFAARLGVFTPPFLHIDDIASELEGFTIRQRGNIESIAWFEAAKNKCARSCDF
jgi:ubiquinone/menaquinone biosynthesis C-methylase UbiE